MAQVKAGAAPAQADAVVLRGRGGLETYLVCANGLVFWDEENVLELEEVMFAQHYERTKCH